DPMINFDSTATENFLSTNLNNANNEDSDSDDYSNDARYVLGKKTYDFQNIINQIGGRLLYIKSGSSGHTFKGIVIENGVNINYAVKVVGYPKNDRYGDINNIKRPENAELMMIKALSYFVVKKQTPHIVLPIGTFNTSIKPFLNLVKDKVIVDEDKKKYIEFVERYNNGELYDYVSILISEWANRGDLLDFIRKNYKEFKLIHWKVFFFQIISVLAVIQSKYPSFRHNDLKANNILVHKVSQRGTLFSYTVNRCKYVVPSIGYLIKLWDFDFACIPGIIDNTKVSVKWTDKINVKPEQNRYYDMHYFFNTLIKKGFFPQFMEEDCIPKEAKDFVNRIVPRKLQHGEYVATRGRIMINAEYMIPDNVLKNDPFFEEFRNSTFKKKNKPMEKKLNTKKTINLNLSPIDKKYILDSD
ncbi:MAG: serine/threonine protein kinase, partial [Homavirus sp.]